MKPFNIGDVGLMVQVIYRTVHVLTESKERILKFFKYTYNWAACYGFTLGHWNVSMTVLLEQ